MFEKIIGGWIKKKVIEWLAKAIGLTPEQVTKWIDLILEFVKEIFGAFNKPEEAVEYMRVMRSKLRTSRKEKARAALMKAKEEL